MSILQRFNLTYYIWFFYSVHCLYVCSFLVMEALLFVIIGWATPTSLLIFFSGFLATLSCLFLQMNLIINLSSSQNLRTVLLGFNLIYKLIRENLHLGDIKSSYPRTYSGLKVFNNNLEFLKIMCWYSYAPHNDTLVNNTHMVVP